MIFKLKFYNFDLKQRKTGREREGENNRRNRQGLRFFLTLLFTCKFTNQKNLDMKLWLMVSLSCVGENENTFLERERDSFWLMRQARDNSRAGHQLVFILSLSPAFRTVWATFSIISKPGPKCNTNRSLFWPMTFCFTERNKRMNFDFDIRILPLLCHRQSSGQF